MATIGYVPQHYRNILAELQQQVQAVRDKAQQMKNGTIDSGEAEAHDIQDVVNKLGNLGVLDQNDNIDDNVTVELKLVKNDGSTVNISDLIANGLQSGSLDNIVLAVTPQGQNPTTKEINFDFAQYATIVNNAKTEWSSRKAALQNALESIINTHNLITNGVFETFTSTAKATVEDVLTEVANAISDMKKAINDYKDAVDDFDAADNDNSHTDSFYLEIPQVGGGNLQITINLKDNNNNPLAFKGTGSIIENVKNALHTIVTATNIKFDDKVNALKTIIQNYLPVLRAYKRYKEAMDKVNNSLSSLNTLIDNLSTQIQQLEDGFNDKVNGLLKGNKLDYLDDDGNPDVAKLTNIINNLEDAMTNGLKFKKAAEAKTLLEITKVVVNGIKEKVNGVKENDVAATTVDQNNPQNNGILTKLYNDITDSNNGLKKTLTSLTVSDYVNSDGSIKESDLEGHLFGNSNQPKTTGITGSDVSFSTVRESVNSQIDTLQAAVNNEWTDYNNANQGGLQNFTGLYDWKSTAEGKITTYEGYYNWLHNLETKAESLYNGLNGFYSNLDKKLQDDQQGGVVHDVEEAYDNLKSEFLQKLQRGYDDVVNYMQQESQWDALNLEDEDVLSQIGENLNNVTTADIAAWFSELVQWKNSIESTYNDYNSRSTNEATIYNKEYYGALKDVYNFFKTLLIHTIDIADGNNNQQADTLAELTDAQLQTLKTELGDAIATLGEYEDFADVDNIVADGEISDTEVSDII